MMRFDLRFFSRIVIFIITAVALCACTKNNHEGAIRHVLWDASQKPMYQQCANDFQKLHPDVRIRIQQLGWDDYWSSLSTGFVAQTAPDVFTNHLAKYPEFVENDVLLDLAPLIARDKVSTDLYMPGLYENWSRDGRQFALPADWDTIALIVNMEIAQRAGVTPEQLKSMTWNPTDGGSFGRIAALLTQDEAGRNALDSSFDKSQVKVRGFQVPGPGGMMGQSEWSHFAASNGFRFQDKRWSSELRYDDPKFAETIAWLAGLATKGISATPQQIGRKFGAEAMFTTGRAAMAPVGSWMTNHMSRNAKFAHAWVPLPVGPSGHRHSMLNGLGHSIWIGSKHREQAWQWVKYLGSPACQRVVAGAGVVYPAIRGFAEIALEVQRKNGAEAGAYIDMAREQTFAPPIAPHAAEVNQIMDSALEGILFSGKPALPTLQRAQKHIQELMTQ